MKKTLIRNTLSKIEKQLPFDNIKKCHRSYLANLNLIEKITGNAQGYRLHFPFSTEITVPVSRSKGKELLDILEK
jgi:DNA-binding LytR/AlgR family response regulator